MELGRDGDREPLAGTAPARRSLFRREAVSIAELGVQTFAVVLGILLALAIDGWRKDRETGQGVATAMSAIHAELAANAAQISATHDRLHALLDALAADEKVTAEVKPCNEYEHWNGIGLPVLLDAAYQTTIATQALAHTDFSRAQVIAKAYGLQQMYLDERGKVIDVLMRLQPMPAGFCRGVVEELTGLNDSTESAYTHAIEATRP
ncbi:MAG TPA: hypothetical protein VH375_06655 [Rhodanobacteraceae bacterium]